jgi:alpha-galactosidase
MIALADAPLTLEASTDRREVLRDATVVICTIGVGGRRAWEEDVFIPRKYGIFMPVGDTVGPGGSSRALRMIPAMVAIAKDVLDLAPQAFFVNYGNPMAPVCRAIIKATGAPVVGLCHGVFHTGQYIARALRVDEAHLQ